MSGSLSQTIIAKVGDSDSAAGDAGTDNDDDNNGDGDAAANGDYDDDCDNYDLSTLATLQSLPLKRSLAVSCHPFQNRAS